MSKSYHTRTQSPASNSATSNPAATGSTNSGLTPETLSLVQRYEAISRARAQAYLRLPNVTSVGVGWRMRDGKPTDELSIQFTVSKKLPQPALLAEGITPLPKQIDAGDGTMVPVDVVERSYKPSYTLIDTDDHDARPQVLSPEDDRAARRRRADTMVPGISISHFGGSAGTLGAIVYDPQTGEPFVLSNWHVLHGEHGRPGDAIVQPGPYDDPAYQQNVVGRLVRGHLGVAGDCAIATIEGRDFATDALGLGVTPRRAAKVSLGDRVVKSGRTTGVTRGVVSRVGVVVNINYGGAVGVQQVGGFEVRPDALSGPLPGGEVSDGGDSGSAWMIDAAAPSPDTDDPRDVIVGLHFAGETDPAPSEEHALACNIHSVLEKLNVTLTDPAADTAHDRERLDLLSAQVAMLARRLATAAAAAPGRAGTCSCHDHAPATPAAAAMAAAMSPTAPTPEGFPIYGNWCGPMHGSGSPVDDLDRACMNHDRCYSERGYFNCGCDDQLQREIDAALASGNVRPIGRLFGPIIRRWFDTQPCRGAGGVSERVDPLGRARPGIVPGLRPNLAATGMAKVPSMPEAPGWRR